MIPVEEVASFYSFEKATFLQCVSGKRYVIDYTLEQVEQLVNPDAFFRVNRGYLIRQKAIKGIITWSNSRLKLELYHTAPAGEVVSREKVQAFKAWLDR